MYTREGACGRRPGPVRNEGGGSVSGRVVLGSELCPMEVAEEREGERCGAVKVRQLRLGWGAVSVSERQRVSEIRRAISGAGAGGSLSLGQGLRAAEGEGGSGESEHGLRCGRCAVALWCY